eukprot:m51a1_g7535 hypothetical protein (143) ;mRNA; f:53670-54320
MVAVLWRVPFSETISENHFNMRCLRKGECNESLFKFLSEDAKTADGELMREENGYRLCGCMGREEKSILIVDCYESGHVGILRFSEPVHSQLLSPHVHIDSGISGIDPPNVVDPEMASPSLFCKRKYSLKGTAGAIKTVVKS